MTDAQSMPFDMKRVLTGGFKVMGKAQQPDSTRTRASPKRPSAP